MAMEQLSNDTVVDVDYEDKPDVAIIPDDAVDELEPEALPRADDFEAMKKRFFVDLPDHDVEYEAGHTWKIENWKALSHKERGPTFHCGPHPWRILFFPFGNNVEGVSLYLEHGFDEKGPPEGWYACVQFMLMIWNPNNPTIFMAQSANHRFTAEEGDWGFTRFVDTLKLFAPQWEDRDRPMIENFSANISAYVRVLKDPTGVLWHNFINYDSKKETGMVGLKNQGATCYLNSLLQSLYHTNAFRKAVYQIPTEDAVDSRGNSAYALQRLFYQLQTNNNAVSTQELTAAFGWTTSQIFDQQDVQELSRKLMERLEERMKGTEAENALAQMFAGKMKTYISCINVDCESSRIEDFWDIQLNVRGNASLDDSFKDYVQVETLDGENKYFAEGFGLQDANKGVIFESFPEVLHLQLKRFEYDINRDAMMKINDRHEFPEVWDASPYLSENADRSESYIYHLHGVLVHSGELNAGHYYAFLKPSKNGNFYRFDDERVTRATNREALEENYGGEYRTQANGVLRQRNPYTRTWSAKRSMSAYMLVYLRESRLDKILRNDVDPPAHLARKMAEERAQIERRRKELEEAHLYMEVHVATNENFRAHQGFDVIPWKGNPVGPACPRSFRIARTITIGELVVLVAKELNLDPEFCRAWMMASRQNHTLRPDQPLEPLDLTIEEASSRSGAKAPPFRIWLEQTDEKDEDGRAVWKDVRFGRQGLPSNKPILLFLKYFDVEAQTLLGVTHFYAYLQDKVSELPKNILKILGFPAETPLKLFEEIKQNMIEVLRPKLALASSEIQDGDIITVQKSLSEKEATTLAENGHFIDARDFYDYLLNRMRLTFMPKNELSTEDNTFSLDLNRRMSYDQLAAKVGDYLDVDPTYLRFTTINAVNGKPKIAVKRSPNITLAGIMTPSYNNYGNTREQRGDALYYEILEMSLSELETKKNLRIAWLSEGICKEETFDLLVPKNGVISDVFPALQARIGLTDEDTRNIRVFEVHSGKIFKAINENFPVVSINEFMALYAELTPEEEFDCDDTCSIIACFHFDKEPTKTHGVPFFFLIKEGEIFSDTKERLAKRTGIKGVQFQKIRFALIRRGGYTRPEYLEDYDILSEKLCREDQLGLDYPNKSRSAVFKGESIFIR